MVCEKYVASGNDFLIFQTFSRTSRRSLRSLRSLRSWHSLRSLRSWRHLSQRSVLVKKLCDRHYGIGADGLIVLNEIPNGSDGFVWEFYNSDGSVATMCGNGSRAAALYAFNHGLCGRKLTFQTGAGRICAQVLENGHVGVQFPFVRILQSDLHECAMPAFLLDTGVLHLVLWAQNYAEFARPTTEELRELRVRYNANVDVMYVAQNTVRVRTFERGVEAETLACGTGMAACFVVAHRNGQIVGNEGNVIPESDEELRFYFSGGSLWFSGKVQYVATCKTDIVSL